MASVRQPDADLIARRVGAALMRGEGSDGLLVCDDGGRAIFADKGASKLLTFDLEGVGTTPLAELLAHVDDPSETLILRLATAVRDNMPVEFVVPRPAEDDRWIEVRGLPIEGGMAMFLYDVTDRERGERGVRRNEQRLRAANESLQLAHQAARAATWEWQVGRPMRWLDAKAARDLVGLSPPAPGEADAPMEWRSFVIPEDLPATAAGLTALREGSQAQFEFRVADAAGRHRWLRSSAAVIERRPDGGPARICGVTLDITAQKEAEAVLQGEIQERRRAEQRQQLLIHELNHRVKNMLATVQSVARQSMGSARGHGPLADFEDRLMALAWTHDILTREGWAGASLLTVLGRTLAAHAGGDRVTLIGPDLRVSPKMVLALAMGVHELSTNAVKYGALSNDVGRVAIAWRLDEAPAGPRLVLDWREAGGPPVSPPTARGFGSRLLERGLAHELGGVVSLAFEPAGVCCRIEAPFEAEPAAPLSDFGTPAVQGVTQGATERAASD